MNFEELALECFDYQSKHNKLYRQFLDIIGMDRSAIQCVEDIPCMPISFFKHHDVMTGDWESEMVPRVTVARAWVSPRVNTDDPWVRGSTPT